MPAPWSVEAITGGFVIVDASGRRLAYVYKDTTTGAAVNADNLTEDEARRIASNIAKLPELIKAAKP